MEHVLGHYGVEERVTLRIRAFCADDFVNVCQFDFVLLPEEHVGMREYTLLPLNGVHPAPSLTKDVTFYNNVDQLVDLKLHSTLAMRSWRSEDDCPGRRWS